MHNIKCIISAEALFKASESSPIRKTGKVEMSNSCGRETLTFPTLPIMSVQTAVQPLTTMQSSGFPTHVDHHVWGFRRQSHLGLLLCLMIHRIKQAQCTSPDSTFFLKSMSWTRLLRTTSHQTQATNHLGLDRVLPSPMPLASEQDQINTIAIIPDQQLFQEGSSIYAQPLEDFGHAMCISIKCMGLDAVLTPLTIFSAAANYRIIFSWHILQKLSRKGLFSCSKYS